MIVAVIFFLISQTTCEYKVESQCCCCTTYFVKSSLLQSLQVLLCVAHFVAIESNGIGRFYLKVHLDRRLVCRASMLGSVNKMTSDQASVLDSAKK